MFNQINQSVEVIAKFTKSQVIPVKFLWSNREIVIKKINLVYSKWEGRVKYFYFAVSDDTNYFKLQFNTENLTWVLLETYVE